MITMLFDLDGTLVDSSEGILDSLRHMLAATASRDRPDAELRSWIGPPLQQCAAGLAGASTPDEVQTAVDAYRARYRAHGVRQTRPFPGIPDLLAQLQGTGRVTMGVATSKPTEFARQIIKQHGLDVWLPVLHGADWEGKLTKSDLVLAALRELGGVVDRAVMIGDRHYDVNGAHEHGLSAVGVGYGFGTADELESAGADIVCNSVAELRDALFHFIDSC